MKYSFEAITTHSTTATQFPLKHTQHNKHAVFLWLCVFFFCSCFGSTCNRATADSSTFLADVSFSLCSTLHCTTIDEQIISIADFKNSFHKLQFHSLSFFLSRVCERKPLFCINSTAKSFNDKNTTK